jgi:hypothetical protein
MAVGLLGVYASSRVSQCRAGADWVANRRSWVRTYELVKATCHTRAGDPTLRLVDSTGRHTTLSITTMHNDRDIWDYTYNGILHSVIAGGAQTNGRLHMVLQLPYPSPTPAAGSHLDPKPGENDSGERPRAEPWTERPG